jgi:hypothetical protein
MPRHEFTFLQRATYILLVKCRCRFKLCFTKTPSQHWQNLSLALSVLSALQTTKQIAAETGQYTEHLSEWQGFEQTRKIIFRGFILSTCYHRHSQGLSHLWLTLTNTTNTACSRCIGSLSLSLLLRVRHAVYFGSYVLLPINREIIQCLQSNSIYLQYNHQAARVDSKRLQTL